jgi:hypothetical protein
MSDGKESVSKRDDFMSYNSFSIVVMGMFTLVNMIAVLATLSTVDKIYKDSITLKYYNEASTLCVQGIERKDALLAEQDNYLRKCVLMQIGYEDVIHSARAKLKECEDLVTCCDSEGE